MFVFVTDIDEDGTIVLFLIMDDDDVDKVLVFVLHPCIADNNGVGFVREFVEILFGGILYK